MLIFNRKIRFMVVGLFLGVACGQQNFDTSANSKSIASEASGSQSDVLDEEEEITAEIPIAISGAYLTCQPEKSLDPDRKQLRCPYSADEVQNLRDVSVGGSLEIPVEDSQKSSIALKVKDKLDPEAASDGVLLLELAQAAFTKLKELVRSRIEIKVAKISPPQEVEFLASPKPVETPDLPPPPTKEESIQDPQRSSIRKKTTIVSTKEDEDTSANEQSDGAGVNLIKNGSFENLGEDQIDWNEHTFDPARYTEIPPDSLPHWENDLPGDRVDYDLKSSFVGDKSASGWQPAQGGGKHWIELCASQATTILQTVSGLHPGEEYILSFSMAARPFAGRILGLGDDFAFDSLVVEIGADRKKEFSGNLGSSLDELSWGRKLMPFTATSSEITVKFSPKACTPNGLAGAFLDDISLTAAPPEASE